MKYFGDTLSEQHKALSAIIKKKDKLEEAKAAFLTLHAELNCGCVSDSGENDVDRLLSGISDVDFVKIGAKNEESAAWVIWHLARIEDMTMNILVAGGNQLFDDNWQKKIGANRKDTGNAMNTEDIISFGSVIDRAELMNYRNTVARNTREIVKKLSAEDMKRRVSAEGIAKIKAEGGVDDNALGLLDYWGGKDVAGLLLMPPTRHVILHLNAVGKWKENFDKNRGRI